MKKFYKPFPVSAAKKPVSKATKPKKEPIEVIQGEVVDHIPTQQPKPKRSPDALRNARIMTGIISRQQTRKDKEIKQSEPKPAPTKKKKKKSDYWKPVFKYGIEVPRNAQHAQQLDEVNGDTKWAEANAIAKS